VLPVRRWTWRARAFGLYPLHNRRVPHICLVLADVGYRRSPPQVCRWQTATRVPHVRPSVARISYHAALAATTYAAFSQRKPHEIAQRQQPRQEIRDTWAENDGRPQISYFALLARATCAALLEESRMQSINATDLHRKPGGKPTTAFGSRSMLCSLEDLGVPLNVLEVAA